jgi:anti-sigma regulatory factor (Ser/Thr protein kinase)
MSSHLSCVDLNRARPSNSVTVSPHILSLSNRRDELHRLSLFVDQFCELARVPDEDRRSFQVALEEVAMNIIEHGYKCAEAGHFTVSMEVKEDRLTAVVTDRAPAYDPLARAEVNLNLPFDQRPIGGLGVHLVKKLMDARYERRGDCNILTLSRTLLSRP